MLPATAAGTVYGLLAINDVEVALPLDLFREVIPAVPAYRPVPMTARGLLGTIVLRGLIIPVVDIADRIGSCPRPADAGEQVIAIVVQDGRVLGLLADGVRGVVDVPAGQLQRLAVNSDEPPLFSACFSPAGTDSVTSVLDGGAIFSLPGIPVASQGAWTDQTEAASAGIAADTVMLFDVGGSLFGLDVAHVTTVLPAIDLQPSVLDGALCRGVTAHLHLHVPVADPLALFGFGVLAASDVRQGVVLGLRRGYVALALSDMHAVVRVHAGELRPLPTLGVAGVERFSGLYTAEDGRHYLMIDGRRLAEDPDLDTLSSLNTAAERGDTAEGSGVAGGAPDDRDRSRAGGSYLTYDIGTTVATPLDEVVEILGYPEHLVALATARREVVGTFVHRGSPTPLVDLGAVLRPARPRPIGDDARVLLVPGDGGTVGFVVAELHAIEVSVWESEPEGEPAYDAGGLLAAAPLLEFGTDGAPRLVAGVTLDDVLQHLLPRPVVTAPTESGLVEPAAG